MSCDEIVLCIDFRSAGSTLCLLIEQECPFNGDYLFDTQVGQMKGNGTNMQEQVKEKQKVLLPRYGSELVASKLLLQCSDWHILISQLFLS